MDGESGGKREMLERFSLVGKVALVTGASRGIGQAMAMGLAEAGADMALVARTSAALEQTAGMVRDLGRTALVVPADVSRTESIRQVVDRVLAEYGRIDILLNAAGTQARKPALEMTEEDWDTVTTLNLKTVYFFSKAVAPFMIAAGKGKIINIASLTASIGIPNVSAYAAAKGGVLSVTRAMAVEWARQGINVNAIAPGYFRTELTRRMWEDPARSEWIVGRTPMGRWGDLEDLKGTAVFLASEASDFITGQLINVDGGWLAS